MIILNIIYFILICILFIILLDLYLRFRAYRIQLIKPKHGYPKHIQLLLDPLLIHIINIGVFLLNFNKAYTLTPIFSNIDKSFKTCISLQFNITYLITWNPEYCKQIFLKDHKNWGKVTVLDNFNISMGEGVASIEGKQWKLQRSIINFSFTSLSINKLLPCFLKNCNTLCDKLDKIVFNKGLFEPYYWMNKCTLDNLGIGGFGIEFDTLNDKIPQVCKAYKGIVNGLSTPLKYHSFFSKLPLPCNRKFNKNIKIFNNWANSIIASKYSSIKGNTENINDFFSAMILSHYSQDNNTYHLNEKELVHNILLFFLAGHETASGVLTFTLQYLATYPTIQDKCRKEIYNVFNNNNNKYSIEDINNLKYLNNVIKESMRMKPPAFGILREALNDCELDGYFIPKGTIALVRVLSLHYDPDIWENPYTFNPDRWNNNKVKGINYIPFGAGSRLCLGKSFATLEIQVILIKLLQRYVFEYHEKCLHKSSITTKPHDGYQIKIKHIN